jgi:hypothetical protein
MVLPLAGRAIRRRRRFARAAEAEGKAVGLAERAGYRVVGLQVPTTMVIRVDGRPVDVDLRADMIVERGFRRFVAEVKSGRAAPDPTNRATRRQLLEYRFAFDADGLLLFDMEANAVREICFDRPFRLGRALERAIMLAALASAGAILERTFHIVAALG